MPIIQRKSKISTSFVCTTMGGLLGALAIFAAGAYLNIEWPVLLLLAAQMAVTLGVLGAWIAALYALDDNGNPPLRREQPQKARPRTTVQHAPPKTCARSPKR